MSLEMGIIFWNTVTERYTSTPYAIPPNATTWKNTVNSLLSKDGMNLFTYNPNNTGFFYWKINYLTKEQIWKITKLILLAKKNEVVECPIAMLPNDMLKTLLPFVFSYNASSVNIEVSKVDFF